MEANRGSAGWRMGFVWISLLFGASIVALVRAPVNPDMDLVTYLVVAHFCIVLVALLGYRKDVSFILIPALLVRMGTMLWDLYARAIYTLPNAAADADNFYARAVEFSREPSAHPDMGLYPRLVGSLFRQVGESKLLGQYLNVLLGVSIVVLIWQMLELLNIDQKNTHRALLIAAFFPNSIIMSAVFLRETPTTFFVALGMYACARWIAYGRYSSMAWSVMAILAAAAFHSAMLGLLPGLALIFLSWDRSVRRFRVSGRSVVTALLLAVGLATAFSTLGDSLLLKFGNVEEFEDVLAQANRRAGGSAYLLGLEITSPSEFILFTPIKGFFFLTAPLPFDWRGPIDAITFLTDSALFLAVIMVLMRRRKFAGRYRALLIGLAVALIGAVLIFAVGVGNAGTAVRHRQKLVPVAMAILAVGADPTRGSRRPMSPKAGRQQLVQVGLLPEPSLPHR